MTYTGGDAERGKQAIRQNACPTCHIIPGISGRRTDCRPAARSVRRSGLRRRRPAEHPRQSRGLDHRPTRHRPADRHAAERGQRSRGARHRRLSVHLALRRAAKPHTDPMKSRSEESARILPCPGLFLSCPGFPVSPNARLDRGIQTWTSGSSPGVTRRTVDRSRLHAAGIRRSLRRLSVAGDVPGCC